MSRKRNLVGICAGFALVAASAFPALAQGSAVAAESDQLTAAVIGTEGLAGMASGRAVPVSGPVQPHDIAVLLLDKTVVAEGETVKLSGTGFGAGETVEVTVGFPISVTLEPTATADGAFEVSFAAPAGAAGVRVIEAIGKTSGKEAATELRVTNAILSAGGHGNDFGGVETVACGQVCQGRGC